MNRATGFVTSGFCIVLVVLLSATGLSVAAPREVDFWTWTSGESYRLENEVLDGFRKANPDINLLYNTKDVRRGDALLVAIIGGAAPDLVTTHQEYHRDFADQGAFLDLRPYIERDRFNINIFPKGLMEFYTGPNGEITGLPWQFTTMTLGYNKDLFDARAVAHPTRNWTLDDMVQAARKLTVTDATGAVQQWGLHAGVLWEFVWRLWGVSFMSADGLRCNLADPRSVAAFEWYVSLFTEEQVAHSERGGSSNLPDWMNGKIAMTWNWPHYLTAWGQHLADTWDVEEIPTGPIGAKVARGATAGWAIPVTAKNPELAWEVLKFLSSRETQLALLVTGRGGASLQAVAEYWSRARTGTYSFKAPNSMRNIEALINGYSYNSIDNYPTGFAQMRIQLLLATVNRMIRGEVAPQAALTDLARQIEAAVAQAAKPELGR